MIYVQFGGFTDCPDGWINYEPSMHLRLSRIPILGHIFKRLSPFKFSENILVGDIVKGLPIKDESVDVVFSSHVIEHLSRNEAQTAFDNVYKILKPGGMFRLVVPDLFTRCKYYVDHHDEIGDPSSWLMNSTHLGMRTKPTSLHDRIRSYFSTSAHKWMWDEKSLSAALATSGFHLIRRTDYGQNADPMFARIEKEDRFRWAPNEKETTIDGSRFSELSIEATKPPTQRQ